MCNNGYILAENGHKCIIVPYGIVNCLEYDSDGTTCNKCKESNYLKNGRCHETTYIEHCSIYNNQNVCDVCKPGY